MNSALLNTFPRVTFYTAPSKLYVEDRSRWRRMTPEEDARAHTGYDRETREPQVGVAIRHRQNGRYHFSVDLWRVNLKFREDALEPLAARWREEITSLPKTIRQKLAFSWSASILELEAMPPYVDGWRAELERVLSDPRTYERI
jgi:hypothetical protein